MAQVGEQISALLPDVVRGELIECATAESDITEDDWQYVAILCQPPAPPFHLRVPPSLRRRRHL